MTWYYTVPFAGKFCLALLIKEEFRVTVSPAVPFHNLLPVEKQTLPEVESICTVYTGVKTVNTTGAGVKVIPRVVTWYIVILSPQSLWAYTSFDISNIKKTRRVRESPCWLYDISCWHFNTRTYSISLKWRSLLILFSHLQSLHSSKVGPAIIWQIYNIGGRSKAHLQYFPWRLPLHSQIVDVVMQKQRRHIQPTYPSTEEASRHSLRRQSLPIQHIQIFYIYCTW